MIELDKDAIVRSNPGIDVRLLQEHRRLLRETQKNDTRKAKSGYRLQPRLGGVLTCMSFSRSLSE
jgi:hypothetical protein